jgi:GT2 family glycosyltransferase
VPAKPLLPPPALVRTDATPLATIIIPTRDRLDLLVPCLDSLKQKTADNVFEVIVVDNDSTEAETRNYLESLLPQDNRFKVLSAPGPFNFSALCNKGALRARGETLIFLNNDIEVISRDWLTHLLHWSRKPDIGAVGAKLVYADNTLQHGGVVLGIDGRAAHFERNLEAAADGFFGRLNVPHELSAVTAACFAVSAAKFQSVNGFDERNLPVDLSDIDLCLRLGERGWRTVLEPRAVLYHHESASRGKKASPEILYPQEITYFKARWLHALRNDPYFHPALSLDWFRPALG